MEKYWERSDCQIEKQDRLYYWVTNDTFLGRQTQRALALSTSILRQQRSSAEKAFFSIGYGPTISMAPAITECCKEVIVFDSTSNVLCHHRLLVEFIKQSETPSQVYELMGRAVGVNANNIAEIYRHEAETFGIELHWINSERFPVVRRALNLAKFVYVNGNFLDTPTIRAIIGRHFLAVANLTNIHYSYWLRRNRGSVMDLIATAGLLPEETVVIFSHSNSVGKYPEAQVVRTQDYVNFLRSSL